MMSVNDRFFAFASNREAALRYDYFLGLPKGRIVQIPTNHRVGAACDILQLQQLSAYESFDCASEMIGFYRAFNGAELFRVFEPRSEEERPLINLLPVSEVTAFSRRYETGGDRAFVIDHNKSKSIYRTRHRWIAFCELHQVSCLTMFLEGEHAGSIFYVVTQPEFNILRPIAKSFSAFILRMLKDPASFLRLLRCTVVTRSEKGYFGHDIIEYVSTDEQPPS